MFDFLFNGVEMVNAIKGLVITVGVLFIVVIILKSLRSAGMIGPLMKIIGKVLSVCLIAGIIISGAFAGAYINFYYKREGGVVGKLTSYVYNTLELSTNSEGDSEIITYSFENLVFKTDDTGKYSIVFSQPYKNDDYKTKFNEGTNYNIFVVNNGKSNDCNNTTYDNEWIHSEYSYIFYDDYTEDNILGTDTLTFNFCFYDNYSYLKITSDADEFIIQLWNAYFNKFSFNINIEVVDEVFKPDTDFTDSVDEGFVKINYYLNNEIYKREIFETSDETYTLPTYDIIDDDYIILNWMTKTEDIVESISLSDSAIFNLYADLVERTKTYTVNYYFDSENLETTRYYRIGDALDYTPKYETFNDETVLSFSEGEGFNITYSKGGYTAVFQYWKYDNIYVDSINKDLILMLGQEQEINVYAYYRYYARVIYL